METNNKSKLLDVEEFFNEFIIHTGDKKVSDLITKDCGSLNADYCFRKPDVICELKTMKKDVLS